MRKKRKGQLAGLWFVLPDLAGVCCFALLPMAEVIRRSFQSAVTSQWMGLKNYREVLGNTAFRLAAANTLKFTAVCIPLLVVCSLLLAVLLQRMKQAGKLLKSAFLLPVAVPAASVVLVWKTLFHSNGLLNGLLEGMGGEKVGWMTTGAAFWVLVLSYLWKNLGYDMVLWMAGLAGIPREIYEAARVDGAGEWKCFTKITLPNLLPSLYTISVLSFLNSFKVFREAWLVAGDYPQQSMYLLQHLYNNWFRELAFDKIAAGSVLTSAVVFGLILLLKRAWDREERPGQ
ncbi:MAG TPA: sugar ABC transporter permease [Candidatus Merdiplasma excrementigallinarum]|uniref:Sugar ABC transporter permease n=1 Tax=Candidatus Merdiplasma excrementigallinarum TaxID=2840864 RepID=A0A9D1NX51_9FIRM|nr:sugar ABC transporter permease [Candidatus Merdiplasma excrementigallinarum]